MNNIEFSNEFDTLLDSYKLSNNYGLDENIYTLKLDEYEKSVYLTNAQNDVIIELYTGRGLIGESYEQSEELRRYLSNLNKTKVIEEFYPMKDGISENSIKCNIEDNDLLWITQEQCTLKSSDPCIHNKWIEVVPISRDKYNRLKNNPFKNKKIWRIDWSIDSVELVSNLNINSYRVSYIRKPRPIILEDLHDLTINGESSESECELHIMLHKYILEKAVAEAYKYMATNTQNNKNNQE